MEVVKWDSVRQVLDCDTRHILGRAMKSPALIRLPLYTTNETPNRSSPLAAIKDGTVNPANVLVVGGVGFGNPSNAGCKVQHSPQP